MEDSRSISISSSFATRIQKIRERMIIEQVSGIPASDKDVFLSLCHQYELQPSIDDEGDVFNSASWNRKQEDDWMKWPDEWGDWFKLMRAIDTNTQVL